MKRLIYLTGILLVVYSFFLANNVNGQTEKNRTQKISTNDHYKYIAINEVLMWVSNNGDGSHDPRTDGNGYYWPRGEFATKSAIFEDGLVYGGKVNGQIRVNGNTHRQGLQAGRILSPGVADDPTLPKYRVYRIRKDWQSFPPGPVRTELERDYNEWPVEDGAPWEDINGDGVFTRSVDKPKFEGDEVLWYVSNDLDTGRTSFTYGSPPMGLEFQTTVYGFFADSSNLLGNVVFKKYKVINKNDTAITDMYFSYWTDDDLGDASDDFVGFDTTLHLGYTYNADNDDGGGEGTTYGFAPPAVGHMIIQAPIVPAAFNDSAFYNGRWRKGSQNLKMQATGLIIKGNSPWPRDCQQGVYAGTLEWYNLFQGLHNFGTEIINPITNTPTKFPLCGDPVMQTGWYEGSGWPGGPSPADRRFHMPVGPFNMAPGDTQEVVIAILISKSDDNIHSVGLLKKDAAELKGLYESGFQNEFTLSSPIPHAFVQEGKVSLWWGNDNENFEQTDKLISHKNYSDSTYNFEGYKIWQFTDSLGSNPELLAVYDYQNDVQLVKQYVLLNGLPEYITVLNSPNLGLKHFLSIERDTINQQRLLDGFPYYFGISSFAYSPHSFQKILESKPQIITVIPGRKSIDVTYNYSVGDTIRMQQTSGTTDADLGIIVIDPGVLNDDVYEVSFVDVRTSGSNTKFIYNIRNTTSNDTLVIDSVDFSSHTQESSIINGLMFLVDVTKSITSTNKFLKNVVEVNGPGGILLPEPVSVFEQFNSTGNWKIETLKIDGTSGTLQELNYFNRDYNDDLEIRFTNTGSEYYTTGYSEISPILRDNPKGKGRVPFEIWKINRDGAADQRLYIKIFDNGLIIRDTSWSYSSTLNRWESIHAYVPAVPYQEPIPDNSGTSNSSQHLLGLFSIVGNLPEEGTVIRVNTKKPPRAGDVFTAVATAPTRNNFENAKQNIDQITIFPNPYFGSSSLEAGGTERIVRLTNLPQNVIVRIYSLAGVFIKRIDKETPSPWLDWDLRNEEGSLVGSGVYLVYLDMPGIGTKILKLAVVQSN
ncbi:MAG: hypothetical protein IPM56_02715 [Ignavibacteriales bacterium]|nr:MAG: hypothetical protein IPM56_02715 [Ignavibacteriales bacterium]